MKMTQASALRLLSFVLLCPAAALGAAAPAPATTNQESQPLILDIARFYNTRFDKNGSDDEFFRPIAGRQVFDGLPFQIDGGGWVTGKKLRIPTKPEFTGIKVGRRFDELHVLHVARWADVEGQQIAFIRFNYADGTTHQFPILYGGQVRDEQRLPSEEKELVTDPDTKVVCSSRQSSPIRTRRRWLLPLMSSQPITLRPMR
jgi:hypothetical protein